MKKAFFTGFGLSIIDGTTVLIRANWHCELTRAPFDVVCGTKVPLLRGFGAC